MIRIFRHYMPRWSLLLVVLEALSFIGAVYAGVGLRFLGQTIPGDMNEFTELLPRALTFMLVMVISMTATGRYQRLMEDGITGEALRVATSVILGLLAMAFVFYALPDLFLGRGALGYALLCAILAVILLRWFFFAFLLDQQALHRRILVFGAGERAAMLLRPGAAEIHEEVVGFWPAPGEALAIPPERVIQSDIPLRDFIEERQINEIILASTPPAAPGIMAQLLDAKAHGIIVTDLAGFYERELCLIHMEAITPEWWVLYSEGLHANVLREVTKKIFDIGVSLLLLFALWPLMFLTALAIRLEDGGPVIFRQPRVGYGGRIFEVMKFRSMRRDAEGDGVPRWASENDARITRVGRFIRKARLDELPQLFNVLRGEMSLVGPRPERPEFVQMLSQRIPYYSERLRVKPGVTGWAQISYGYGASENDACEKLKYDLYYVKNHGLFLDLMVLVQSLEVVLFGGDAPGPRRH
ncbi:MAG: TIGR03013 family PEP-CTERM/XrtA system glycosyltransferase [Magnetococcales bacterium]|nr:TIGR03013 family PEP-CTERM/XrtA system glycosyltransferase [Magnetococcales bacterium]